MEFARECNGATSYDRGRYSGSDRGTLRSLRRRADVRLLRRGPVSWRRANVVTPLASFQTPALSGVFLHSLEKPILVPGGEVESPRYHYRRILSPLRLPVPPSRLWVRDARRGALPGGRKGGIIAESCGGAKRDAVGPAKGSPPSRSRMSAPGRPKRETAVRLGGKARSAKGVHQ